MPLQLVGVRQVPQLWLLQRAQPRRPQRGRQEQEGGRRGAAGGGQAGEDAGVKERISQMGHVNFAEFFILTPPYTIHATYQSITLGNSLTPPPPPRYRLFPRIHRRTYKYS